MEWTIDFLLSSLVMLAIVLVLSMANAVLAWKNSKKAKVELDARICEMLQDMIDDAIKRQDDRIQKRLERMRKTDTDTTPDVSLEDFKTGQIIPGRYTYGI